jgi:hypothetical protein
MYLLRLLAERIRRFQIIHVYSEFVLSLCVFLLLFLVVGSQILMRSGFFKTLSVTALPSEGMDLSEYSAQLTQGTVSIRLEGVEDIAQVTLFVNGEPYGDFSQNPMTVTVGNHALLEVDGRKVDKPFSAAIVGKSENVSLQGEVQTDIQGEIRYLARVLLKNNK